MTDPGDYHNFCLLTDVFLLADMFKKFRDVCLQQCGLDPAHNYTFPGLSWEPTFEMRDVELDLLTDIDQHLLREDDIAWGLIMIWHQ